MRSFKVTIVANNEAGTWQSWPLKIAVIKLFYLQACELDITLVQSHLTPQFTPYEPTSGNGTVYRVDETWYEQNVSRLAQGADILVFVVPPSDHSVVTLMGLEAGDALGNWETTVFSDENSHTYVNEIDQGETAVVYTLHELSHVFYAMLKKEDNTHLYFFAGTPEKVLSDFNFDMTLQSWYQKLIPLLQALYAALGQKKSL